MQGVPLLLGAKPNKGLMSAKVPIHAGTWSVWSNHNDSEIVIILDTPPHHIRHILNGSRKLEVLCKGVVFAEVLNKGTEKHISISISKDV